MAVTGRVGRLTALALATGTIVAAGTGVASASAASTQQMLAGGEASAVKLTINLPAAAASVLGTNKIVQTISLTNGEISTVGLPTATTKAVRGTGTLSDLVAKLGGSTTASLGGKLEDSSSEAAVNQAGINASVLTLASKVADPSKTVNGTITKSSSSVAHVGVAAPLTAVQAVTAPVTGALDGVINGVAKDGASTATGALTGTLETAIDTLNGATGNAAVEQTAAVEAAVETAVDGLNSTLQTLTGVLSSLTGTTDLVSLDAVTSDQAISRSGKAVTSTSEAALKNLSVLNGLVKVEAFSSVAKATAAGTPGTAHSSFETKAADLSLLNGAITAKLDQDGLKITNVVTGGLPPALSDTVNTALDTVAGTLQKELGIELAFVDGAKTEAADGSSATAQSKVAGLKVDPEVLHTLGLLPKGTPLMQLDLVSANASVGTQIVAAPTRPTATPTSLPRTGGSLPLGIAATTAVGIALVIRRRRTAEV